MKSSFFLHRTLRHPFNIKDVLCGVWVNSEDTSKTQLLFNLSTSFQVLQLQELPGNKHKLQKRFSQTMLSKIKTICSGPLINGLNSFFALRENDIIQFHFSEEDNLFLKRYQVNLPSLLISSNYIFFKNCMLTISSSRGGIGTIDFSGKDPLFMYTEKPTNCCHQCFPMSSGFICRLEGDSKIIHYTQYPGTPIHVNTSSDFEITHFFEFQNEIILCGKGVLVMPNGDFINLPNTMDTIIDHTLMTDSIILLLTSSGLLLQFNDCYDLTTIETHPKSTNIYHLSDELFLIRYPSRYCIGSINDHTVSTRFTTSNGIKMLKYGSQIGYISPYFITSSNNNLILLKQGSTVGTISTTTISDPIYGIHVFEYELRHFVAISHHSSTRLLEITGKQIQMSNAVKLKENSTTLGIAVLKTKSNSQAVIQIAPESIIFCSSTKNKEYTLQAQNAQTVAFAHNSKQILIAYSNRTVFLIETQKGNGNDIDKTSFEQAFSISTMALSKSDPLYGNAEMVAYGGTDQKNQFILIQMVSFDQAARTKVLTELMPWNVVSLEFLNETLLCIGLGNGAIVIGNVNQAQRHLEKVVSIQIGSGPCFLSKMFYKNAPCVFALNSRPCVIHAPKGIPLISPLSMTSVSFAAPAPIDGHFLSVTGQNLSVNVLSDINNEFSNTVFPMESEIVTFTPMHRERFIIIASSNALYVMDPIKNNARNLNEYFKRIDYFENETVISIDVSNPSQVDKPTPQAYLSVVTRTPDNQSILRLYTFNINSISTQIHTPIIGNYCQPINACCCVVIGNAPHIIACSDESVLDFKSSNRLIRLVVQIDQVGNEMTEIFYSHHIDNEYYFFIGDKKRSVKLIELNNELKQFNIIAEEGFPRRISTISKYGDTSVSGGDEQGNIFIMNKETVNIPETVNLAQGPFNNCKKLKSSLNYFIGDIVVGTSFVSGQFNYLWYCTSGGGFGCFMIKPKTNAPAEWNNEYTKQINILRILELEIASLYYHLTGCDQITFRNSMYPSTNVIDIDTIEIYFRLKEEYRTAISRKLSEIFKTSSYVKTPADIDFLIHKFLNYFLFWKTNHI